MGWKPSERRNYREKVSDLNLTPMMNLVAILIPILLISLTYIEIANIEVQMPAQEGGGDPTAAALDLRLRITAEGYILAHRAAEEGLHHIPLTSRSVSCRTYVGTRPPPAADNAGLPACASAEEDRIFTVYDRDALTVALVALKGDHPGERGITVSADEDVPFEALVNALDASRTYEREAHRRPLFDQVMFSTPN